MSDQMSARQLCDAIAKITDPYWFEGDMPLLDAVEALIIAWHNRQTNYLEAQLMEMNSRMIDEKARAGAADESCRMMQDRLQRLVDANLRMRGALADIVKINAHLESHNGKNATANETLKIARIALDSEDKHE